METIRNFFANLDAVSFIFGYFTMAAMGCLNSIDKEKGGKKNVTHKF